MISFELFTPSYPLLRYTNTTRFACYNFENRYQEEKMPGGKYKNIILVGAIITGLFAFMAFTWVYVIGDINKGRSCIRTCDTPITKGAKRE